MRKRIHDERRHDHRSQRDERRPVVVLFDRNGTYTSTLTISSAIGATNTVFYVKASSVNTESPGTDTSVTIDVTAVIVPT